MLVRARLAFEERSEFAAAREAVAAGFGSAVMESEVNVVVEITFAFVEIVVVSSVEIEVMIGEVIVVCVVNIGRIVCVDVTVGRTKEPERPDENKDEGSGTPVGKGIGEPAVCDTLLVTAVVALPPPFVMLAETDIQGTFPSSFVFSQNSVQPAVRSSLES